MPANRSEKEVKNYFDILKTLPKRAESSLTLELILDLHKDLMVSLDEEIAGAFRNRRVVVGKHIVRNSRVELRVKHEPPFHTSDNIRKTMFGLVEYYDDSEDLPLVKIGMFHHQYVYIHPFVDGNGRTVRLMTALLFIKAGYQINKYFVLDDYYDLDRKGYSNALHSADSGDSTKWLEYFTDGVKYSLSSALARAKNLLITLDVDNRPTPRERGVLELFVAGREIITNDVVEVLGISRQQAQNLLAGLVEKGLVSKRGITKGSFYILK
jgi:Fic family protein